MTGARTKSVKRRLTAAASVLRRERALSLDEAWAVRLGIDTTQCSDRAARADRLEHELHARFEHLTRFLLGADLGGEMPRAGKSSAETGEGFATAYGDLWVLTGFLADARHLMSGEHEEARR